MFNDEARIGDERRLDAPAKARELTGELGSDEQRLEPEQRGRYERIERQTAIERGSRLRDDESMSDA
jgi:hypothetical protein